MAKMTKKEIEKQMAVNHGRVVNAQKVREMKEVMEKKMAKRQASKKII